MDFENTIFRQAVTGSYKNPGLPPSLASLVVAQSKHETGNYTSNFFLKYNNAFGYTYIPGDPLQSGSGTMADNGQAIAAYNNIQDSTREIIDWIYRRQKEGKFPADLSAIQTPDQYATLLKSAGYYQDTLANYASGLKKYFIQILQVLQKPYSGLFIVFVFMAGWYLMRKK
jgi:uncharacterized FlgJ-related protein